MSFHIVASGKSVNEENTILKVEFSKPFRLRGEWEVGIISSSIETKDPVMLWVICNVVDFTLVNNVPMQVVDIVPSGLKKNIKPAYVRGVKKTFSSINVEVRADYNSEASIKSDKDITCVLHFRKT